MARVFHLKNGESLKDTPHIEEMPFEEVTEAQGKKGQLKDALKTFH